jgi:hypothetical protein
MWGASVLDATALQPSAVGQELKAPDDYPDMLLSGALRAPDLPYVEDTETNTRLQERKRGRMQLIRPL